MCTGAPGAGVGVLGTGVFPASDEDSAYDTAKLPLG
jgi:hypothetical protein